MCLVAFQKIFRKIFSGVWKRRRKTQIRKHKPQATSHNPEKKKSLIPEMFSVRRPRCDRDPRSRSRRSRRDRDPRSRSRHVAIRDRDRAGSRSRLLHEIAIDGAISPSIAISDWSWSSRSRRIFSSRALSLSLSLIFRKSFEGKIKV